MICNFIAIAVDFFSLSCASRAKDIENKYHIIIIDGG